MFRILILQASHALSDERTEHPVRDRLSFMRFLGRSLADRAPVAELEPAPLDADLPVVSKEVVHDFLADLGAPGGYIVDKLEGFAFDAAGEAYAVTDNDGVV
jgi:hypothetical protein